MPLARSCISLTILLILSVAAQAEDVSSDWPQFLGPQRNGVASDTNLSPTWPTGGAKVLWTKEIGQGLAGPVISGQKLVLFHRLQDKETIECMDGPTGKRLWLTDYPTHYQDDFGFDEGPRATPSIDHGNVYTFGAEGMLTCCAMENGKILWQLDTRQQFGAAKGFFGMACSPLVEGDAVILDIGGGPGAGIVAFDKSSGKLLWKTSDEEASYSSPVAATIDGKRYLLVFDRAGLAALNPGDGRQFFHFPWRSRARASVNAATPLVIGNRIFLSASYGTGAVLLQFKELGPQEIWSGDDILSNHYATSVYHDGFLYGFDGRQENGPNLRCVDAQTGKVRWSQDNFGAGTLMIAGERLLILTEKGELIMGPAGPSGFKPMGRAQILPFDTRAYPALAGGLYFARGKDKLVCVDLRAADKN